MLCSIGYCFLATALTECVKQRNVSSKQLISDHNAVTPTIISKVIRSGITVIIVNL